MAILGKKDDSATGRPISPADAHTILGKEAQFSGKLVFPGVARIDGRFEGEIETEDLLLIGPGAEVKAEMRVGSVIINGNVEGDIHASVSVEIKAPGRVRGNITTPILLIERGVVFDGSCHMADSARPRPSQLPAKLDAIAGGAKG